MLNPEVRFLVRWFVFLAFLGACGAALPCCGSVTQGKNQGLQLHLQLPEGEDPTLFWFGVSAKALRITSGHGDPSVIPWQDGQSPAAEVREGDKVEFFGSDDHGKVLVTGEAQAGGEKSLTIPLRRVL